MNTKDSKGVLPSDRAKTKEQAAAELEEQRNQFEKEFKGVVGRLGNTPDGQFFFRWLKGECGFGEPILAINPVNGDIDERRTLYAAMRLNLYLKVRKYFQLISLNEIEVDHV